jgi:MSHA biogenesis protein MshN
MSLINQVLNELESRGANVVLGETTIRAVPQRKQLHVMRYALVAVTLLILLAAAKWYLGRADTPAFEWSAVVTMPLSVAALAPSSAVSVSAPGEASSAASDAVVSSALNMSYTLNTLPLFASRRGKPLLEVQSEEEPVVAPEVKKSARHRSKQTPDQITENIKDIPTESPVDLQLKKISPQQHAENEYSKANRAVQEGRINDALAGYEGVLRLEPLHHAARQALVGVLLRLKRNGDAESVLQDGLRRDPHQVPFAMLLARLQVERGAVALALETLQKTLPSAEGQGDYQAFMAALLQRLNRHDEAVSHYQIALKLLPNNGIWLMGMGISLQALQRKEDARNAYQRALASNSLNAQLQAFVQNKLKEF